MSREIEVLFPILIGLFLGMWQTQQIGEALELLGRINWTRSNQLFGYAAWLFLFGLTLMAGGKYVAFLLMSLATVGLILSFVSRGRAEAKRG